MGKSSFLSELSSLLHKYKIDTIIGADSLKIACCIYNIIYNFYDLPNLEGDNQ